MLAGYTRATATYSATVCPPAPSPWISRPATSTSIVGASPAITRPTTNRATATYSGAFGPHRSLHAPTATIPMTLVASVPANATAYSASPSRSALTIGMTVVTASA